MDSAQERARQEKCTEAPVCCTVAHDKCLGYVEN